MADNESSAVSIVGILAIVILVGLAVYFIFYVGGGDDDDLEVDVGELERDAPVQLIQRTASPPPPVRLHS